MIKKNDKVEDELEEDILDETENQEQDDESFEYYQEGQSTLSLIKKLLIGLLIIIAVMLIIFLLFYNKNKKVDYTDYINEINTLSKEYFKTDLPIEMDKTKEITLKSLIEKDLIKKEKKCDLNKSKSTITLTNNGYKLITTLVCDKKQTKEEIIRLDYYNVKLLYEYKKEIINTNTSCPEGTIKENDKCYKYVNEEKTTNKITNSTTLYIYEKQIKTYSDWSDWSNDIEYTPTDNIVFGMIELSWKEKSHDITTTILSTYYKVAKLETKNYYQERTRKILSETTDEIISTKQNDTDIINKGYTYKTTKIIESSYCPIGYDIKNNICTKIITTTKIEIEPIQNQTKNEIYEYAEADFLEGYTKTGNIKIEKY